MNERIKSLLNVCGMPNEDLMEIYSDVNKSFYMEQFAELIIKECANIAEEQGTTAEYSFTTAGAKWFRLGAIKSATMIKRYFGVK